MFLINSSPQNALRIFQPFLPIFVPVGIGSIASVAEREGIKFRIVDEQVEESVLALVDKYIREFEPPYIFAFSTMTIAFKSAILASQELKKKYPNSTIVFGGIHPTAMSDEVLSYNHIDLVIRGEGEKPLIDLYKCIKQGRDYTHIPNLSYRRDGRVIHNNMLPPLMDIDSLPPFPYHLFDPKKYDLGFVLGSRGCPYNCIFCSNRVITGKKYRFRSADVIVEELSLLNRKYGRNFILFLDDNFMVDKKRVYALIEKIRNCGLHEKMTFSFQARGDNVDSKILTDLYEAGFKSIFFGMETSSEAIMKFLKKGETVEQCIEAVKLAKKIGYHVSATFIYGFPGETHEDRMNCVRLSKDLRMDMVRYNNATPYPGTELYESAGRENRLNIQGLYENFLSVSTFTENPFKPIPFTYVPQGTTEKEIRRDLLFSYFSFYLDVSRLKEIFVKPNQGVGWFNAGEKILDIMKKVPALTVLALLFCVKFYQLFYYCVIHKETAISLKHFLKVFDGLRPKKES